MTRRISVVGLGKLGAGIAAAIASRGHQVIGVDSDPHVVDTIAAGGSPVAEPGLPELVAGQRDRLRATADLGEAVGATELSFVIVPTPSRADGRYDLGPLTTAVEAIGTAIARKDAPHTVVITSTVPPGATRRDLLPLLRRTAGDRFGLCYSPVLVALGSVVRDFLHPDLLLIGELDRASGDHLEACYRDIIGASPAPSRMTFENAELAKLAINAYVTMKITFANMLAGLCDATAGADVDVVSDVVGRDSRIGRKYLTGGLGFGGPCFPRDNASLAAVAVEAGVDAGLPRTTDRLNRAAVDRVVGQLRPVLSRGATVAVLGLAYKPGSEVVEESQALAIANALSAVGRVTVFDPLAAPTAGPLLAAGLTMAASARDCVREADVVVVATPDPAFRTLERSDFAASAIVVDYWRLLADRLAGAPGIDYRAYGRGPEIDGDTEL